MPTFYSLRFRPTPRVYAKKLQGLWLMAPMLAMLGGCTSLEQQVEAHTALTEQSLRDYQTTCLQASRLMDPVIAGKVIETPRYALITLQRKSSPVVMGGELCIINKITHHREVTSVDNLTFLDGLPAQS